jgi:SpoVK/Ycf46/Vps4 family AAA+-type ATPase
MPNAELPPWVDTLKRYYLAGSSSFFILHGNVDDVVGTDNAGNYCVEGLSDFLAKQLFSQYDLVLHYDLGRGLRPHPGGNPQRLTHMNSLLDRLLGEHPSMPTEPTQVLRLLDRLITLLLVSNSDNKGRKTAFIFDYAEWLCPPGERNAEHLAMLLNWARSPVIKRVNMVFVVMAQSLAQVHPALVQSGYTTEIRLPVPDLAARSEFVTRRFAEFAPEAMRLATLSAGLTLANLDNLLRLLQAAGTPDKMAPPPLEPAPSREIAGEIAPPAEAPPPSTKATRTPMPNEREALLSRIKKELIEAQCPGLLEFVEPKLSLDMVAGHAAAKKRLADDAALIRAGELEAAPMGYLICGPVGVGKTFLAMCYAGTVGIPCVTLRNFRSKYVGETEANLERILNVLRELGPVAVIIDEADAAVGDRNASGDSGTSARVFAQLSSQMGNTAYRGKLIWFMLTCRPDLLPIDLKRQGRCEEHIPLFYPETPEDLHDMFMAMGKKLKLNLSPDSLPDFKKTPALSGADIEGILTRVRRDSLLRKKPIDREMLASTMRDFRSMRNQQHELQWLAAILECTDLRYFPGKVRHLAETDEGMAAFARRFQEIQAKFSA